MQISHFLLLLLYRKKCFCDTIGWGEKCVKCGFFEGYAEKMFSTELLRRGSEWGWIGEVVGEV